MLLPLVRCISGRGSYLRPGSRIYRVVGHAVIDDEDKDLLQQSWRLSTRRCSDGSVLQYAFSCSDGRYARGQSLHRIVAFRMGIVSSQIDHQDRNGLNCRRSNLRSATHSQNLANSKKRPGTSRFRGVSYHRASGQWQSAIQLSIGTGQRKLIWLGLHPTEEAAAFAYNQKAFELYGAYANLNQVPGQDQGKSVVAGESQAQCTVGRAEPQPQLSPAVPPDVNPHPTQQLLA